MLKKLVLLVVTVFSGFNFFSNSTEELRADSWKSGLNINESDILADSRTGGYDSKNGKTRPVIVSPKVI